ncbi:MAG: Ig-like domain repeat protein, partial [Burkholderiales bacterium]|nr:Ig-like domain repeat protein [Burkholderiales bacterium]
VVEGTSRLMRIPFFDDATLLAEITHVAATSSGGQAYTGHVPGVPHSSVVLVNNNGVVSMSVKALARQYTIQGSGESGYVASELQRLNLPDHSSPPIPVNAPPLPKPPFQTASDAVVAADSGPQIDVMVVYTPVPRANNGGTAQMHANIDGQVAYTNLIYSNSNVVQRLRLVYKGEVAYTETTDGVDLSRLANPADGFLDTVPILRDIYKADFVSLWGNYPTTCGLGYVMTTESSGFAGNAYNAVNSPACTDGASATFAHELGHNMGLHHDNFESPNTPTTVTPEAGGAATLINYAHGYIDLLNRFRTVMSYNDQCVATPPGTSCERIPNFSNPAVLYNGFTTGNATNAHERQALNDTLETTRNFRTGLPDSAFTGPGIVTFSASTYSVAEGGGSVQLTVERHVGFTGPISVNYATANGTATAGADFTTTSGTLNWATNDATTRTIIVPILQDALLEGKETFTVTLSTPGGVSIGALNGTTTTATVTIIDDEPDTFPVGGVIPAAYVTPASSSAAWTVDLTDGYLSPNSLQSAAVLSPGNSVDANSDLEYTATFLAGNVSFAYRVSSLDTPFANMQFMVDDIVVFSSAGGDTGWLTRTEAITAGVHTLRWRFRNGINFPCANAFPALSFDCADRAWIDSVVLPLAQASSTTTLASSRNPSFVGQSVTFTATVASGAGTPTGSVAFRNDGNLIAGCSAVTLSAGSALCVTTGLLKGLRSITAQYAGSGSYIASTSVAFSQSVNALSLVPIVDFLFD